MSPAERDFWLGLEHAAAAAHATADALDAIFRSLEPCIRQIADEQIAAAVDRAKAARAAAAAPTAPEEPPLGQGALCCRVCTSCHEQKERGYFSVRGWESATCLSCETLRRDVPREEPQSEEWEAVRGSIAAISQDIEKAGDAVLRGRWIRALEHRDHLEIDAIRKELAARTAKNN